MGTGGADGGKKSGKTYANGTLINSIKGSGRMTTDHHGNLIQVR